jgi:hypothetical protein
MIDIALSIFLFGCLVSIVAVNLYAMFADYFVKRGQ